jgi:hypothetical protein
LSEIKIVKAEQPEGSGQASEEFPRTTSDDSGGKPFQSAWEKWCNAKYGTNRKMPYHPANSEDHSSLSRENIDPAPITNFNCRSKNEIMTLIQKWSAWAKTQKSIYKNRVTWGELALRLTWGFTENLDL